MLKKREIQKTKQSAGLWCFHMRRIEEYAGPVNNSSRGWYRMYTFKIECEPNFDELKWCACTDEKLALLLIDLSAYRDRSIVNSGIEHVRSIFRFFKSCGKEMIVRFAYDTEGKGMEKEPTDGYRIREHMRQLGFVVREFPGAIFCLQGLLIGSWGEMHQSAYLSVEDIQMLSNTMWKAVYASFYLSMRSPLLWRTVFYKKSSQHPIRKKIGLFDDALFGSETDLGTFAQEQKESYDQLEKWSREKELDFEDEICRWAPNGGEVVYSEEGKKIDQVIAAMRKMHLSYLNCEYDEDMLGYWKETKWTGETPDDKWIGKSVYDYIGDHLGYRLVVRDIKMKRQKFFLFADKNKYRDGALCMEVTIENIGFAGIYRDVSLYLVLVGDDGNCCYYSFVKYMNDMDSGALNTYSCLFMPEEGNLYLQLKRRDDDQMILFANESFPYEDNPHRPEERCRKGMNWNTKKRGLYLGRLEPRQEGE